MPIRAAIYLKASTCAESVENQRRDLLRVAKQRGWRIVGEYIDEGVSASKGQENRPEFDRLAHEATQGNLDLIAAWSIDRIGHSLHHLINFIANLYVLQIDVYLHKQQIDSSTAPGRAMLGLCGVFAEFERSLNLQRISAGLARARAQGKHLGRPRIAATTEDQIRALRATGAGIIKIAKRVGVGTGTVQRVLSAPRERYGAR